MLNFDSLIIFFRIKNKKKMLFRYYKLNLKSQLINYNY